MDAVEEGVEVVLENVEPNRRIPISISYRSRGLDTWSYVFQQKGFTGLAITLGSIVTLFALMQLTAATDWDRAFAARGTMSRPRVGEV